MTSVALPIAPARPLWRLAQGVGVALTLVLMTALWVAPRPTLHVLWDMVIPLLPAVFLVNPLIWRNVCPLATLNELSGNRPGRRAMSATVLRTSWIVGIALLFVLVPARRYVFNEDGRALAITITAVALLAVGSGLRYARRGGFCSSICPVLPVEKLYGQLPLLPMAGVRCQECSICSPVGCIDLAGTKVVAQTIGPLRRDAGWLRTGFGAFAAAFPGFVLGYFTAPNGDLTTAFAVYLRVLGFAVASYVVVALTATTFRLRAALAIPLLGATALGIYYWYAAPTLTKAYGAPGVTTPVLRLLVGGVLTYWLWFVVRPVTGRSGPASAR